MKFACTVPGKGGDYIQNLLPYATITPRFAMTAEIKHTDDKIIIIRPLRASEIVWVIVFALCNLALPLVFGELYPFTIAPMFRDRPQLYCQYRVVSDDGTELSLRDFELHRNYDGNPVGFGAGIKPHPSLDQFGTAPDEEVLRSHVSQILNSKYSDLRFVDVVQTVIGPTDSGTVDVIREVKVRVYQNVQ